MNIGCQKVKLKRKGVENLINEFYNQSSLFYKLNIFKTKTQVKLEDYCIKVNKYNPFIPENIYLCFAFKNTSKKLDAQFSSFFFKALNNLMYDTFIDTASFNMYVLYNSIHECRHVNVTVVSECTKLSIIKTINLIDRLIDLNANVKIGVVINQIYSMNVAFKLKQKILNHFKCPSINVKYILNNR